MRLRTLILLALLTQCGVAVLAQWVTPTPRDIYFYNVWMDLAYRGGVGRVYSWPDADVEALYGPTFNVNYPPLIFYLYYPWYWLLKTGGVMPAWPSPWLNLFFRLPVALLQTALYACAARALARYTSRGQLWLFALLGVNPALLLAGEVWGQFDALVWGCMFLSLELSARERDGRAGALSALAATLKPQFLLFLPALLLAFALNPRPRRARLWLTGFGAVFLLLWAPFLAGSGWAALHNSYSRVFGSHTADTRTTAFNLWWLVADLTGLAGPWASGKWAGLGLMAALDVFLLAAALRRRGGPLLVHAFCAAHLVGCFTLLTGMQARFLVYGLCSACLWAAAAPGLRAPAVVLSALQVINLSYNALWNPDSRWGSYIPPHVSRWACDVSSLLTLLVLGWLVWQFGTAKAERSCLGPAAADALPGAKPAPVLPGREPACADRRPPAALAPAAKSDGGEGRGGRRASG